jgi:NAD-dependent DNA ligase
MDVPAGWSRDSLDALVKTLPAYTAWREKELPGIVPAVHSVKEVCPVSGVVVFTGFRDAELAKRAEARGFAFAESITKKTTILVAEDKTTQKVVKARDAGIEILDKAGFVAKYLS